MSRDQNALLEAAAKEATRGAAATILPAVPVQDVDRPTESPDFTPVNNKIYIFPHKKLQKRGNIHLPVEGDQKSTGTVLASNSTLCGPGDTVLIFNFRQFEADGKNVFVCDADDILGVRKAKPSDALTGDATAGCETPTLHLASD